MSSYMRRVALAAATTVVAACVGQSTAPVGPTARLLPTTSSSAVERTTESWLSSFEGVTTYFFCEDGTVSEGVALEGHLFVRNSTTATPSGTYILTSHSMPVGLRGTGLTTGQEYRVREQSHYAVSQREVGYAGTFRNVFELTGRESMDTFKLVTIAHFVITPDGEVVVERQTVNSECAK